MAISLGIRETDLVDHHDSQEIAGCRNEQSVNIVACGLANSRAQRVQNNLANNEEDDGKGDIAQRPSVLQCAHNEDDLHGKVNDELDGVQEVQDNKEADRVGRAKAGPRFEGSQGDQEGYDECDKRSQSEQPYRQRRTVFVQLKAHKSIDQKTGDERRNETRLHGDKVRVGTGSGRHDTGINTEREEAKEHVKVEEGENLLATNGCELAADVKNHDNGHDEGEDVHETRGALENDGVGDLNISCIAIGLDAHAASNGRDGPDICAER